MKKHDVGLGNNIENYTATSGVNAEDIEINAYMTYEHRNIFNDREFDYRLTLTAEEQRSVVLSNRSKIFLPQRKQMPITEKEIAQYEHLDLLGLVSMFYYEMSLVVRKPVFGVSDLVPHKPGCAAHLQKMARGLKF